MGGSQSQPQWVSIVFPLTLPDCASLPTGGSAALDPRPDYLCSSSDAVLWPITVTHLIVLACVFFAAMLVYAVTLRVRQRAAAALRRRLPLVGLAAAVGGGPASGGGGGAGGAGGGGDGGGGARLLTLGAAASVRAATSWTRRAKG